MKRRTIIFGLCMIILLSSVIAIDSKLSKDLDLSESKLNRIKKSTNITKINISISDINCNNDECWSKVSQKGVINTEWRRIKTYCSEYYECLEIPINKSKEECIEIEIITNIKKNITGKNITQCTTTYYIENVVNNSCDTYCIKQTEYSLEENQQAIIEYINKRLNRYADAEMKRKPNLTD